jgi:hypothetical protein
MTGDRSSSFVQTAGDDQHSGAGIKIVDSQAEGITK